MIITVDQLKRTIDEFEKEYNHRSAVVKEKVNNGDVCPEDFGWFNSLVFALNNANDELLKSINLTDDICRKLD